MPVTVVSEFAHDGDDEGGRWFGLWITIKATGGTTWCGSLKFDKSDSLKPSGGTAPEIFGRGSVESDKVPEWHISIRKPVADDNVQSSEAYIDYSNLIPNGNVLHDYGVHDKRMLDKPLPMMQRSG